MSIANLLNLTAVVQKKTTGSTAMGGTKFTWTTRIAALRCRIGRPGGQLGLTEADQYGKMTVSNRWRVYCEATATNKAILVSDRIVVEGKTLEITGIYNACYESHHLEIDCLEVD